MITDIRYGNVFGESRLRANSHVPRAVEEREATLLDLRHRFRHVRRVLVTFASGHRYVQHQRVLTASAAMAGEFHTVEAWSFDRLKATPFFAENRSILQRFKGQGYWLWKPYVIWRALEASEDGDLIAYNDCLPEHGNVFDRSILPMLAWLSEGERRIAIARKPALNREWTKRDCFYHMGCDSADYWEREQVIATYMAFVAGPETRAFVRGWLRYCQDPRILTDDPNTCGLENLPGFQEHRHDQSVLSNLLIRDRFELPDILFGRDLFTKHFQAMLGVFEDALVRARLSDIGPPSRDPCVSVNRPWMQSSASPWSPAQGVMAEQVGDRDFFFHTDTEENPWWLLDLESPHRVSSIEVLNRPDIFAWRANRLQVYVGISQDQFELIYDAVAADWDADSPLHLVVRGKSIRFVKIALDNTAPLHLKSVRVFGSPT